MRKPDQRALRATAVTTAAAVLAAAGWGVLATPAAMAAPSPAPRPFAQALQKTLGAKTSDVSLAIAEKVSGETVKITAKGAFDYAHNEGDLTMNLNLGGLSQKLREVLAKGNAYLQLPAIERSALGGKSWIAVPLSSGSTTGGIGAESPTSALALLQANATAVKKLGTVRQGGVKTTEYSASVDPSKAIKNESPAVRQLVGQALASYPGLHAVPLRVWVDGQNRLREMTTTYTLTPNAGSAPASAGTVKVSTTVKMSNYGVPVSVKVPPAGQVSHESLSQLGAGGSGGAATS